MQTSEHLIAYQTVRLSAYERLRETLVQQQHVFESVVTEAYLQASGQASGSAKTDDLGVESFILMCSPTLNVLLTAVPVSAQAVATQAEHHPMASKHARFQGKDREHVFGQAAFANAAFASGMAVSRVAPKSAAGMATAKTAQEYRVGLTFDDRAIAVFADRLSGIGSATGAISAENRSIGTPHTQMADSNPPSFEHSPKQHRSDLFQPRNSDISEDEKLISQKAFVLTWAKSLATSPEGDAQLTKSTLDNQLQQSLLLDQVITRIRHSLDLSAILETTVAQVREFLSADRLVLYQFDHFHLNRDEFAANLHASNADFSSLQAMDNLSAASVIEQEMKAQQLAKTIARRSINQPAAGPSDTYQQTSPQQTGPQQTASGPDQPVGKRMHSGHVTYESRVSEGIPSVLHLAESDCFAPPLPMRDRYLTGQPIAIDNVDEQYADVQCLLAFLQQANIKSKIIAPIIVKDQLWGLLIAHQCQDYRHWEETETVFLQHIAEHLAVAISQASLYQQLRQQTVSLESCVIERTQSLHDALIAAESANITKGEFLSTMSHELRTPLTYIIGMSATLLRWSFGDLNERQRSYLTTINQSGEQLLDIINNILEFASVESGRSRLDFSELSLSQLLNGVIARHQDMSEKQNVAVALDFKLAAADDLLIADAKRLQQILSNLLHNAIKFTGGGGQVTVQVWRESQTTVFQIKDTGIGIPSSQQDILFEKFKQLESPFQRQYSGTGLGLAMTKHLVEMHGGTIKVESEVGLGSTFTVRLPVPQTPPSAQHYQVPSTLKEGPERVILLEKDENNAAIACEMLTAAGYEVIWLVESDRLAGQLELLHPIMLIADLSLLDPKVSNIKEIQHSITALNAKVLALSAQQELVPSAMAHHDVLRKPIDPKALLAKVRQLMLPVS